MALLCMALHDAGVEAESFTGSQAGFITDTNHTNAKILELRPERVLAAREGPRAGRRAVAGVSSDRDVTFLGRGGSDTTAVALAHALGADACELYTDVSGVFTRRPRLVPRARRMAHVSFDELLEMTATAAPSRHALGRVRPPLGRHAARPLGLHLGAGHLGARGGPSMEQAIVSAVTHDVSEAKVTVSGVPDQPGIAARLFRELAEGNVNVDMIVQNVSDHGVTDISFTVPRTTSSSRRGVHHAGRRHRRHRRDLRRRHRPHQHRGAGMKSNPGVAATMFATLANDGVNIEMISTSAIRISCVVRSQQIEDAVGALHTAFGLDV
jgi:aspartate kinase